MNGRLISILSLFTALLASVCSADDPTPTSPTYAQLERLIQSVDRTGGGSTVIVSATYADEMTVTTNAEAGASVPGRLGLYGAGLAEVGSTPYKAEDGTIAWSRFTPVNALTVAGICDGVTTEATCTNRLTFVSSPESNVKFTVRNTGNGNVEVSIGVFYK